MDVIMRLPINENIEVEHTQNKMISVIIYRIDTSAVFKSPVILSISQSSKGTTIKIKH